MPAPLYAAVLPERHGLPSAYPEWLHDSFRNSLGAAFVQRPVRRHMRWKPVQRRLPGASARRCLPTHSVICRAFAERDALYEFLQFACSTSLRFDFLQCVTHVGIVYNVPVASGSSDNASEPKGKEEKELEPWVIPLIVVLIILLIVGILVLVYIFFIRYGVFWVGQGRVKSVLGSPSRPMTSSSTTTCSTPTRRAARSTGDSEHAMLSFSLSFLYFVEGQ